MSREPLDLRRSLQILRRRLITVGIAAVLGAVAGAAYTVLSPPMHAGTGACRAALQQPVTPGPRS